MIQKYFSSIGLVCVMAIFIGITGGCKKTTENVTNNILEQYFEQNILNRDFIVNLATDSSVDITDQFSGYKFKLFKNTLYDGPMTATNDTLIFNGTWASNADYGKLDITFNPSPDLPLSFAFINRSWRFVQKSIPIMKLAPWGTTDPKELQMERQ